MKMTSLRYALCALALSAGLLAGCDSSNSSNSNPFFSGNGSFSSGLSGANTGNSPTAVSPGNGAPVSFTPGGNGPLPPDGIVAAAFLYVNSPFAGDISVLGAADNGLLSVIEVEEDGTIPAAVVPSPDGLYLYSLSAFRHSIRIYAVDQDSGELTFLAPQMDLGENATGMVFGLDGQYAYVASPNSQQPGETEAHDVLTFRREANGRLTRVDPPAPASNRIRGIVITPDGKYVYTSTDSGLERYDINTSTGELTQVPGLEPLGTTPRGLSITPDGKLLYVGDVGDGTIYIYAINADGTLSARPPFVAGTMTEGLGSITVHPRYPVLYAVVGANIYSYAIGANGELQQFGTGGPVESGPAGIDIEPSGQFLYVANSVSDSISIFAISQATADQGTLTPLGVSSDAVNGTLSDPRGITSLLNRKIGETP